MQRHRKSTSVCIGSRRRCLDCVIEWVVFRLAWTPVSILFVHESRYLGGSPFVLPVFGRSLYGWLGTPWFKPLWELKRDFCECRENTVRKWITKALVPDDECWARASCSSKSPVQWWISNPSTGGYLIVHDTKSYFWYIQVIMWLLTWWCLATVCQELWWAVVGIVLHCGLRIGELATASMKMKMSLEGSYDQTIFEIASLKQNP